MDRVVHKVAQKDTKDRFISVDAYSDDEITELKTNSTELIIKFHVKNYLHSLSSMMKVNIESFTRVTTASKFKEWVDK